MGTPHNFPSPHPNFYWEILKTSPLDMNIFRKTQKICVYPKQGRNKLIITAPKGSFCDQSSNTYCLLHMINSIFPGHQMYQNSQSIFLNLSYIYVLLLSNIEGSLIFPHLCQRSFDHKEANIFTWLSIFSLKGSQWKRGLFHTGREAKYSRNLTNYGSILLNFNITFSVYPWQPQIKPLQAYSAFTLQKPLDQQCVIHKRAQPKLLLLRSLRTNTEFQT